MTVCFLPGYVSLLIRCSDIASNTTHTTDSISMVVTVNLRVSMLQSNAVPIGGTLPNIIWRALTDGWQAGQTYTIVSNPELGGPALKRWYATRH